MGRLPAQEVHALDPYAFLAVLGKRVIHPAREVFLGQVCPGLRFDTEAEWAEIYAGAGLTEVRTDIGRMSEAVPYLGYVVVEARKPAAVLQEA